MRKILKKFLLILATVFIVVSLVYLLKTIIFLRTAETTSGQVVLITDNQRAVVQFATEDNKAPSFLASRFEKYEIGEQVPVIYNPADPQQAYVNSFLGLWAVSISSIIIGLSLALISLLFRK